MSNLVPITDIERMAAAVAKSGLFGIKTADQGIALMLIAQAEGLHPAIAARDYHVIQGRPALKADAMLARFQQAGGKVEWKVYTDAEVTGVFSHPSGGSCSVTWTIDQARKIGLTSKDNWKHYPRAMLRSRCASEGIRAVFPGCVVGVYTDEETESFTTVAKPVPAEVITVEEVKELEQQINAPAGKFPLYMPGQEGIFESYETLDEWIAAYADMVRRIMGSAKLDDAGKKGKVDLFGKANIEQIMAMNSMESVRWKAAVVQAGGSFEVGKQEAPAAQLEASEETF